jgi:hypothetical protein
VTVLPTGRLGVFFVAVMVATFGLLSFFHKLPKRGHVKQSFVFQ